MIVILAVLAYDISFMPVMSAVVPSQDCPPDFHPPVLIQMLPNQCQSTQTTP
jgi:hypothetical protein